MTRHGSGCRRESVKRIDALGEFGNATVAVTEHAGDPAGIGQPSTHHARDFLGNGASLWFGRLAGVEVIERGMVAEERGCGRKATHEIGDAIAIEKIAFAVVLRMD